MESTSAEWNKDLSDSTIFPTFYETLFSSTTKWLSSWLYVPRIKNEQIKKQSSEPIIVPKIIQATSLSSPSKPMLSQTQLPTQLLAYPILTTGFKGTNNESLSHLNVYQSGNLSERLSFTFSSHDWFFFYELGAALAITELIKPEYLATATFIGSGTGAIVASCLAANIDIYKVKERLQEYYETKK
jgi:hypothetical protein